MFQSNLEQQISFALLYNYMELLGYFLAILVGVSLGIIGGGGSILTVPILVYVMQLNPILATSYSLFIVGSTSMVGAINSYRKGFVNIKTALLFAISSVSTVFLTRKLLIPAIPEIIFKVNGYAITKSIATMLLFAILMLTASVSMIRNRKGVAEDAESGHHRSIGRLLFYGIFIGLVTGLLGAGGGFLIIPVLVLMLHLHIKEAIGTSLLIIALNSLIGFMGDIGHFSIDWKFLIGITLAAIVGIFAGAAIAKKIAGNHLKKAFGWFVLLMGIYIIIKELFLS